MMKRRILSRLSLSLFCLLVLAPSGWALGDESEAPPEAPRSVTLTVDYGDGAQKRFPAIPWKKAFNVLDAIRWADKHPRGIDFVKRGRGETTLVTQIDDLRNGQGDGKSWIYRVNGKLADRSCAVFRVQPGDTILWRFEPYQ